jgi:hypothetical protein
MAKTTSEKIKTIKSQEEDFRSIVRHLMVECKEYLDGGSSQGLLIIMTEIDLLKMKCFSDKTIQKLLEELYYDGKDRTIDRKN